MNGLGPIYSVALIHELPIGGGMTQAMPSRKDLELVRKYNERTAAAYEVLLSHYKEKLKEIKRLESILEKQKKGQKQ